MCCSWSGDPLGRFLSEDTSIVRVGGSCAGADGKQACGACLGGLQASGSQGAASCLPPTGQTQPRRLADGVSHVPWREEVGLVTTCSCLHTLDML